MIDLLINYLKKAGLDSAPNRLKILKIIQAGYIDSLTKNVEFILDSKNLPLTAAVLNNLFLLGEQNATLLKILSAINTVNPKLVTPTNLAALLEVKKAYFGHIQIAVDLAGENDFLSQAVLNDFINNEEHAWSLANVLVHLKKENLIPSYEQNIVPPANTAAMIAAALELELRNRVYKTITDPNNLAHLQSLDLSLRYISQHRLIRHNIDKILNTLSYAGFLGIAMHDLEASIRLDQPGLDRLFADPENARSIAKEIYSTPLPVPSAINKPKLALAAREEEVIPERQYPKPPQIIIRRGLVRG